MKMSSHRSLVRFWIPSLVSGALALQLAGCGTEELPDDPAGADATRASDVTSASGALTASRAAAVDAAETTTTTAAKGKATVSPSALNARVASPATQPVAPPSGGASDLERLYPWVVQIGGTGGLNCRGVLIHPSWVLTAGHCIGPYAGTVSYSRTDATGAVVTDSRSFDVAGPSRGIFLHPDYVFDSGFGQPKNDIALIRLATPFTIDRSIQTVALPRTVANPGRTGTIVTHNHGAALPAGTTAVVRSPQLTAAECPSPAGFLCINPPATSLCRGDSGSGYTEVLNGRATVVGITSNITGSDECIAAGGQAQLTDVFAYLPWILSKMNMSEEQVDGRVRLRWAGLSSAGTMSLTCLSPASPAVEVSMDVPGGQIAIDCEDARVFCQPGGANNTLTGFSVRTITPGSPTTVTQLPYLPSWTAAFADPGASFLEHTCQVGGLFNVATTATVATAAF